MERAGAAACGNPLNPVAAEAAEMLVRAARPTASSTFSGYRYVPAGDLGSVGQGEGRLDRRKSERKIWGKRERESGRGSTGSKAREEHQGALRLRARGASAEERRGRCEFALTSPGFSSARPEGRAPVHACTTVLVFADRRGCALGAVHVCALAEDVCGLRMAVGSPIAACGCAQKYARACKGVQPTAHVHLRLGNRT